MASKVRQVEANVPPILPISKGVEELVNDDKFVAKIAEAFPDIDRVFRQAEIDIVLPSNAAVIGQSILGIRAVRELFMSLRDRGEAVIQERRQQQNSKPEDTNARSSSTTGTRGRGNRR